MRHEICRTSAPTTSCSTIALVAVSKWRINGKVAADRLFGDIAIYYMVRGIHSCGDDIGQCHSFNHKISDLNFTGITRKGINQAPRSHILLSAGVLSIQSIILA